jgi:hypothetical protein
MEISLFRINLDNTVSINSEFIVAMEAQQDEVVEEKVFDIRDLCVKTLEPESA